jgi:translocation and assembly module TamB
VLEDRGPERSGERGGDAASRRLRDDLRGKLSGDRSIDADRIALRAAGLALQVRNPEIEFRLDRGLPAADHFQMDLLGGTVQGNLSVLREGDAYQVSTGCAFSGLRADDLVPGLKGELTPEEAELSGSLSVTVPLSEDTQSVLEGLRLRLNLSHIGSKALERFLYALDPHESNETVVHQRELLKIGTPRWVDVEIRYGTLSLSGELEAKGVRIDLPPIRRLNIGSLALEGQLERHLLRLGPVLEGLRILSADTIELGPDGKVRLHRMDSYP